MIGKTLGQYRVNRLLGAGGMGEVYLAGDLILERDVALKVLAGRYLEDAGARERLMREARTASALNHPHICVIHAVEEHDGHFFIVMERIEGRTLSSLIREDAVPIGEIVRYGAQVADALAHAHQRGIVHRDLKSANVMIDAERRAKVVDFGLAERRVGEQIDAETRTQEPSGDAGLTGTLPYMAPEQLRGHPASAQSDIWALGVILYEASTGRLPFTGATPFEVSSSILSAEPAGFPPGVPESLRATVLGCLEKDAASRYQHSGEVRNALRLLRRVQAAAGPSIDSLHAPSGSSASLSVPASSSAPSAPTPALRTHDRIRSIAVLPLANLAGAEEEEFFSDGMTEALITDLAKISELRVISRNSAMRYKNTTKSLTEIAAELNVDAIVEGSVRRADDQVRITAELIDATSDTHLWAESYVRALENVLVLQSEVARAIAREVHATIKPQEQTRLAQAPAVDPAAHETFLRGRYFWNQRGPGIAKAIDEFRRAIEIDPDYAPAHAGLADAHMLLGFYGFMPPAVAMPAAKESALRALELDPGLADVHSTLGFVHQIHDWDWAASQREFLRAIELNPSYAPARYWYSTWLMAQQRPQEAIAEVREALDYDPLSVFVHTQLSLVLLAAGHDRQAEMQLRRALELDPTFPFARSALGNALHFQGRRDEAIAELERAVEGSRRDPWSLAALGNVRAQLGEVDEARAVIAELEERGREGYVAPMHLAGIHASLGEADEAFAWLERAYEARDPLLVFLASGTQNRSFADLRSDARFGAHLSRIGLAAQ